METFYFIDFKENKTQASESCFVLIFPSYQARYRLFFFYPTNDTFYRSSVCPQCLLLFPIHIGDYILVNFNVDNHILLIIVDFITLILVLSPDLHRVLPELMTTQCLTVSHHICLNLRKLFESRATRCRKLNLIFQCYPLIFNEI